MKLKITNFFENQLEKLSKKFPKLYYDLEKFESNLDLEPFSDLGYSIFKYRIRNSSIPVGKRGGFRIIIKKHKNIYLPLIIYSKTIKENVSDLEIIDSLEKVLKEL